MILHNGRILTLHPVLRESAALAIAGGKVLGGVDSREDAIASHAHERVDLDGLFVAPGFVDSHMHFMGWATRESRLDLASAHTSDALVGLVQSAAHDVGGSWLVGRGFQPDVVPRGLAIRAQLDEATGDRPTCLISADGHSIVVNTAALQALSLGTSDLAARPIEEADRTADGTPTGVLREELAFSIRAQIPAESLTLEAVYRAARSAARMGITSLHDMDGSAAFRWFQQLDDERGLPLRVWQHFPADELPALEQIGIRSGFGRDRLRIGGIKLFADGTLGSGTAWLSQPESNARPGATSASQGCALLDADELCEAVIRASRLGLPVLVHAIGDAAVHATLDAFEQTTEHWRDPEGNRPWPRIEHAQLASDDDLRRAADLGVALSMQPSHAAPDTQLIQRYWADRNATPFPLQRAVELGALVITGSDAPVVEATPLETIAAARSTGIGLDGESALAAATIGPAIASGVGRELGRLMPGYAADLVVLSDDPRTSDAVEVVATMVGGRWTFGRGNLRGS